MLKIQVLGKGLIPRGLGLAPRKDPFPADKLLISTIMSTPGLSVNMINPETNRPIPLNAQNLHRMWDTFANYKKKNGSNIPQTGPSIPMTMNPVTPSMVLPTNMTPVVPANVNTSQVEAADVSTPVVINKPNVVVPTSVPNTPAPVAPVPVIPEKSEETSVPEVKDTVTDSKDGVKPNDQQKSATPGYMVKPINADDRKNSNNSHK